MIFKHKYISYHLIALLTTLPIFLVVKFFYGLNGVYSFSKVYPFILITFVFIYGWMFKDN